MWPLIIVLFAQVVPTETGSCTPSDPNNLETNTYPNAPDCSTYEHCHRGTCRNLYCDVNQPNSCKTNEECLTNKQYPQYGFLSCYLKANGGGGGGDNQQLDKDACPGGTAVITSQQTYRKCNLVNQCPSNELCNPLKGFCCKSLNICPSPRQPQIDGSTKKPKMCMNEVGIEIPNKCTDGFECEAVTGFCCSVPALQETCVDNRQCQTPNSICKCDEAKQNCRCHCLKEFGYAVTTDQLRCERARRRLKERCQNAAQCRSAFADCVQGKCKCRSGFTADAKDGCIPNEYRCGATNAQPHKTNGVVTTCDLELDLSKLSLLTQYSTVRYSSSTTGNSILGSIKYRECRNSERYMIDSCDPGYYCVPYYDLPDAPEHYRGICCPSPHSVPEPKCPVGNPHAKSVAPNFGCSNCPAFGYFCHTDKNLSPLEVCCPSPCSSPGDVYANNQCYPVATYGEACEENAQCVGNSPSGAPIGSNSNYDLEQLLAMQLGTHMACVNKKCECERGFILETSKCVRATCTIGLKSEPLTGSDGKTMRCNAQSYTGQCPMGYQCDATFGVCCRAESRCPGKYISTGITCWGNGYACQSGSFCHFDQGANANGVCCVNDPFAA